MFHNKIFMVMEQELSKPIIDIKSIADVTKETLEFLLDYTDESKHSF